MAALKHLTPNSSHSLELIYKISNLLITDPPFHANNLGSKSLGDVRTSSLFVFCIDRDDSLKIHMKLIINIIYM